MKWVLLYTIARLAPIPSARGPCQEFVADFTQNHPSTIYTFSTLLIILLPQPWLRKHIQRPINGITVRRALQLAVKSTIRLLTFVLYSFEKQGVQQQRSERR
jgi:hypothetical protein